MLFAELRLASEFELVHLGWLEQRNDQTDTGCLPRDDLGPEILAAAWASHECEPMWLDTRHPVQRRPKHNSGI